MTILHYVGRLYSLDTLDTRFTQSAKTSPSNTRSISADASPSKPLWRTVEFYFYYLCFVVAVPLMFKAAYDVSTRKFAHPGISRIESLTGVNSFPSQLLQVRASPLSRLDRRSKGRQLGHAILDLQRECPIYVSASDIASTVAETLRIISIQSKRVPRLIFHREGTWLQATQHTTSRRRSPIEPKGGL